jgi:deoxyribodipyrimidine photo-lyase
MLLFLFFTSQKFEILSSISSDFNLIISQGVAVAKGVPLKVIFNMVPKFLQATLRQYDFMIKGLEEVEGVLR